MVDVHEQNLLENLRAAPFRRDTWQHWSRDSSPGATSGDDWQEVTGTPPHPMQALRRGLSFELGQHKWNLEGEDLLPVAGMQGPGILGSRFQDLNHSLPDRPRASGTSRMDSKGIGSPARVTQNQGATVQGTASSPMRSTAAGLPPKWRQNKVTSADKLSQQLVERCQTMECDPSRLAKWQQQMGLPKHDSAKDHMSRCASLQASALSRFNAQGALARCTNITAERAEDDDEVEIIFFKNDEKALYSKHSSSPPLINKCIGASHLASDAPSLAQPAADSEPLGTEDDQGPQACVLQKLRYPEEPSFCLNSEQAYLSPSPSCFSSARSATKSQLGSLKERRHREDVGQLVEDSIRPTSSPSALASGPSGPGGNTGLSSSMELFQGYTGKAVQNREGKGEEARGPKPILVKHKGGLRHARSLGRKVRFNEYVDEIVSS